MSTPELSVVIATYNRRGLLERLLLQLDRQTLARDRYEVVVVDDGSVEPAAPALAALKVSYPLRVETQANAGAAAARHRGAIAARGRVLVIIDDDMQVPAEFLAEHLVLHGPGARRVVLGHVRQDGEARLPLFERWHNSVLDAFAQRWAAGEAVPVGNNLYTGNVSFRREDYLETGGFDPSLKHSEDAELGLRLEKLGAQFTFSTRAYVLHSSDHVSLEKWRHRAYLYGIYDRRIARKHLDVPHADPWRYLFELNPLSRPLLLSSVLSPRLGRKLAEAVCSASQLLDDQGMTDLALKGTTLAYGLEYFRGLREESGSLSGAVVDAAAEGLARAGAAKRLARALSSMLRAARADHDVLRRYEDKYGHASPSSRWAADVVQKVGLQMMVAYRAMRFLDEAGWPLGSKVASRLIRHLYAADIHPGARFAPGVMIVHGMGLAISHAAEVGTGCILFQNVTLGMSVGGAPKLGQDVHVMPGATLVGPITVGDGSKIMSNVVVAHSVPAGARVEAPIPEVRSRAASAEANRSRTGGAQG